MFSLTDTQTENSVTKAAEQSLLDEPGSYLSRQVRKTDRFLENFFNHWSFDSKSPQDGQPYSSTPVTLHCLHLWMCDDLVSMSLCDVFNWVVLHFWLEKIHFVTVVFPGLFFLFILLFLSHTVFSRTFFLTECLLLIISSDNYNSLFEFWA